MAFTKIAETTFTIPTGSSNTNVNLPGTPLAGDIVIIAAASDSTMTSDGISTAGYTNIAYVNNASPGHQVAYKVMGSVPDSVINFLQNGTSMAAGVIQIWRGQSGTVLDVSTPTPSTSSSGLPNPPSIFPVTPGSLVFAVGLLDDDDAAASAVAPVGYTNLIAADTGQVSTTVGATVFMASKEVAMAGPEDPGVFTGSAGTDAWRGVTFAIRPAFSRVNRYRRIDTFTADGTWICPPEVSEGLLYGWGAGGGGLTATGAGGGAAFMRKVQAVTPGNSYAVAIGVGADNTDGGDTTFSDPTPTVVFRSKGGKSRGNGGTGGLASDGLGDSGFDGGTGQSGAGTTTGGASAGDAANASGITPGTTNGSVSDPGCGGNSTVSFGNGGRRGQLSISYLTDLLQGYPIVKERSWGRDTSSGTSHPITMPSNIMVGDLLLIIYTCDGGDGGGSDHTIAAGGWTRLAITSNGSVVTGAVFYKFAEGGDAATVGSTSSVQASHVCLNITHAGTPTASTANGSSSNADCPSHDAGVSVKHLWLATAGWDGSANPNQINAAPSGYGSLLFQPKFGLSSVSTATSELFAESQVENPGVYTSTTEQWVAFTIAVPGVVPSPIPNRVVMPGQAPKRAAFI